MNKLALTLEQRDQVRRERASGEYTNIQLAVKWDVCVATIQAICNGRNKVDRV